LAVAIDLFHLLELVPLPSLQDPIFLRCSFARLFAKLPRPGDSEVTFAVFELSCHLLLPV